MVVTLLTDYGREDEFAGICHAVIRGIAPEAAIVDLTHGIPRHDVRHGALVLRNALSHLPPGVLIAVVDPEVGTERRAVALRCADRRLMVGPDNGLLSLAWDRAGGVVEAFDVSRSRHRLEPVSATFHGRDLFAPVGAHLAAGAPLAEAGDAVDPETLAVLVLPRPRRDGDGVVAHTLAVDRFGNVALDLGHDDLRDLGLTLGREVEVATGAARGRARITSTFADVAAGEALLYEDANRMLALAVNRGDAARVWGLERDAEVRLLPR